MSLKECLKWLDNLVELTLWLNGNNLTAEGTYPIIDSLNNVLSLKN